jgi:hypothetical protein
MGLTLCWTTNISATTIALNMEPFAKTFDYVKLVLQFCNLNVIIATNIPFL